jgi:hypothetical protein
MSLLPLVPCFLALATAQDRGFCPACSSLARLPDAPPARLASDADAALARGLIAVLNGTGSRDTFCLTVRLLAGLPDHGRKAVPAVLRCAERLGISDGMTGNQTGHSHAQQILADFVRANAAGNSDKGPAVVGVRQVQLDVLIAEVTSAGELREVLSCINTDAACARPSDFISGNVKNRQQLVDFLDALKEQGSARIRAKTSVVTMSGKSCSFRSGGQVAVPEPAGVGTNAVRFEDFGTQLNFLPLVLGNGKIHLELEPIINTFDDNGTTIQGTAVPGFNTQRMHATVEMEPAQTFALGVRLPHAHGASGGSGLKASGGLIIVVTPFLVDTVE